MASKAKWTKKKDQDGELIFEIDQDTISKGLDAAFKKVRKTLNVPGFRKGKVPRAMFNQMYGETALYQDALNEVLPQAYTNALEEADVKPVAQPEISVESMEENKPWSIKATVAVAPEVTLGDYKGLKVNKQDTEVNSDDVDAEIDRLQKQQAELVLKETGKSENGDTVVIDYKGTVDGEAFDGGSADNYSLELGSGSFIPGFEDQLVDHETGDEVDVKVTFPEDYQAEDLAGREAHFQTTIHEIKTKELPTLDDDFAKDVDEDVETLAELKTKLENKLRDQKQQAAEDAVETQAVQQAVENAEYEKIPQAMIEQDIQSQVDQYLGNMQRQGINPQMYYQITGTTEDDLKKQFSADAENRIKTNLLLEAIVKAEDIKVEDDERAEEVKELAADYGMEEQAVRDALTADMLDHDIAIKKVVDLISDSAVQE
ncbi:trigger factor [Bombilactobacillus thymidiniphilus]|uniref:Trigger factor n=1 Tax=Bombilactobacillus thymidiniphilus TaxID=2923363 RepID=A0ABY4PD91_9LACO|nr:trigger factor [Bombilactobacillus thymidiniphilus]UQS83748.1 trigger factor [Bombilactobacillus thymidiniphilus]